MSYTAPNIDAVSIQFEPYTPPADITAIPIGFGDPAPVASDWAVVTPKRLFGGAWVEVASKRLIGGAWVTGQWKRNMNPDAVAPTTADSSLTLATQTETSITVQYTKCTDTRTAQTALVYRLYISLDNPMNTLADVDNFGTLADTGTDVAELTATGLDGQENYYYTVTCADLAGNRFKYDLGQTVIFEEGVEDFQIVDTNFFIESGDTRQVQFFIDVVGATSDEVVWTSSNPAFLTVDTAGIVTGVSEGVVTLTGTPTARPALAQSIQIGVDTFDFGSFSDTQSFTTEV